MTLLTTSTAQGALADEGVTLGAKHQSERDYAVVVAGLQGEAMAGRIPNGPGRAGVAVAGREGRALSLEGGVAVAGHDGFASCGANGAAVVFKRTQPDAGPGNAGRPALAAGGDGSVAIAFEAAHAQVGGTALAFAQQGGLVRGGPGSLLVSVWRISETSRAFVVGQVLPLANPGDVPVAGVQPLNPEVWYRVDGQGRFVPA